MKIYEVALVGEPSVWQIIEWDCYETQCLYQFKAESGYVEKSVTVNDGHKCKTTYFCQRRVEHVCSYDEANKNFTSPQIDGGYRWFALREDAQEEFERKLNYEIKRLEENILANQKELNNYYYETLIKRKPNDFYL